MPTTMNTTHTATVIARSNQNGKRLQADVYAPHIHAHEHLDEAHHQQLHKAMDLLQEPVVRCFAQAGPADAKLSPKAASELLGGYWSLGRGEDKQG